MQKSSPSERNPLLNQPGVLEEIHTGRERLEGRPVSAAHAIEQQNKLTEIYEKLGLRPPHYRRRPAFRKWRRRYS